MTEHELIDYGVSIGWLTPEKAEELKKEFPEIVRCKDCKHGKLYDNNQSVACDYEELSKGPDFFCAYGERKG